VHQVGKLMYSLLYMFRASSAHLQEDIAVYKQHMVPSLSIRVLAAS